MLKTRPKVIEKNVLSKKSWLFSETPGMEMYFERDTSLTLSLMRFSLRYLVRYRTTVSATLFLFNPEVVGAEEVEEEILLEETGRCDWWWWWRGFVLSSVSTTPVPLFKISNIRWALSFFFDEELDAEAFRCCCLCRSFRSLEICKATGEPTTEEGSLCRLCSSSRFIS